MYSSVEENFLMYKLTRKEFEIIHGRYFGIFRGQTIPFNPHIIVFVLFYGYDCFTPHVCMHTMCVRGAGRGQKKACQLLNLELQIVVSCPVKTGN